MINKVLVLPRRKFVIVPMDKGLRRIYGYQYTIFINPSKRDGLISAKLILSVRGRITAQSLRKYFKNSINLPF